MANSVSELAAIRITELLDRIDKMERPMPSEHGWSTYEAFQAAEAHLMDQVAELAPQLGITAVTEAFSRVGTSPSANYGRRDSERVSRILSLGPPFEVLRLYLGVVREESAGSPQSESDESPGGRSTTGADRGVPPDQLVTLDQVAAYVNQSKRSLERYVSQKKLPRPDIQGGGGRPNKWYWRNMRPAVIKQFRPDAPEQFPASRFIG